MEVLSRGDPEDKLTNKTSRAERADGQTGHFCHLTLCFSYALLLCVLSECQKLTLSATWYMWALLAWISKQENSAFSVIIARTEEFTP